MLIPSARPLWRDAATLQLGRSPGRATVVAGLPGPLRGTLELLDGTHDRDQVLASNLAAGCAAADTAALLDLLDGSGLLADAGQDRTALAGLGPVERERLAAELDALALVRGDGGLPALEHRQAARVQVRGAGRVGAALAVALATAGLGAVDVVDEGLTRPGDTGTGLPLRDVGRSRGEAVRELLRAAVPSLCLEPLDRPDLVVLAPARGEPADDAARLVLDGVPHLLVEIRGVTAVVGPLVLPGRTPCLRCLDLTRSDLDPAWPVLAAQLAAPQRGCPSPDGTLALALVGQAAMQVVAMLDGTTDPAALGGTLELTLPDWRWRRRTWPVHRDCGCCAVGGDDPGSERPVAS